MEDDELTDQTFGRLTVLGNARHPKNGVFYFCRCVCGKHKAVWRFNLIGGKIVSCGCNKGEKASRRLRTHGMSKSAEYNSWRGIKERCGNPSHVRYAHYGGRGIVMCERWLNSFENFLADMGPRPSPSHTIERIDNDKSYSPENCRWASLKEQANNKSSSRLLTFQGETHTIEQWLEITGLPRTTLRRRLDVYGWSVEKALGTPARGCGWSKGLYLPTKK